MVNFIHYLNNPKLYFSSLWISNMVPSIDNETGLQAVKNTVETSGEQFPPTLSIIEALELCLKCDSSILNNKLFFQIDRAI